ncbi:MAG: sigma-54-dependent Fis family transcriptional regulator [Ideonella sp. WA131b]|jgi:transcriptional regulator of acetoin/glycerol metabolism|nr:sigma-54-dependent Fis family transcriptional regulator [Ideonella sp. WA131b]
METGGRPGCPEETHAVNTVEATRALARARALSHRGSTLPLDGTPSILVLDSWARCLEHGLDAAAPMRVPVVEAAELARRRERSRTVLGLAQAELETLSRQIAGSNHLLAFADADGVILDLQADSRFGSSSGSGDGNSAGILAGSHWHESVAGTNGLGTALACGQAVAVTGREHWFLSLGAVSCTAAPVRDGQGHIVGVLDASSYVLSRHRHTQALVQMAAKQIENRLLAHQMRGQLLLAVHPRAEYLGTLSAGLLAFDAEGRLTACNATARELLAGLQPGPGSAFDSLFAEPFERLLGRLQRDDETRLRDSLGSLLVARRLSPAPARRLGVGAAGAAAVSGTAVRADDRSLGFVADDAAVRDACRLVERAVALRVPVLLQGETGTGKEVLARHAHRMGRRRGEFVAVNCGGMPAELFEAELFGHVAGAFTGARPGGSPGLLARADGGTLLLDEIAELPAQLQATLLRFLDDGVARPVGALEGRRLDVQVLAATHRDLDEAVRAGRFRADLLYRLHTVRIELPPLRTRSDFDAAAHALLQGIDGSARLAGDALARLRQHDWPGNFRELRSVLVRALLQRTLSGDDTSAELGEDDIVRALPATARAAPAAGADGGKPSALRRQGDALVRQTWERCGRSISRTARELGISRSTVYRHLGGELGGR